MSHATIAILCLDATPPAGCGLWKLTFESDSQVGAHFPQYLICRFK